MNNFSGAVKPTEAFIGHLWVVGTLWWFYLQSQGILSGNFMLLCQTEAQNERLPPSCLEMIWSMRLSMAEGSGRGSTHVIKGYRSREEKERNTIHWGKITSYGTKWTFENTDFFPESHVATVHLLFLSGLIFLPFRSNRQHVFQCNIKRNFFLFYR